MASVLDLDPLGHPALVLSTARLEIPLPLLHPNHVFVSSSCPGPGTYLIWPWRCCFHPSLPRPYLGSSMAVSKPEVLLAGLRSALLGLRLGLPTLSWLLAKARVHGHLG